MLGGFEGDRSWNWTTDSALNPVHLLPQADDLSHMQGTFLGPGTGSNPLIKSPPFLHGESQLMSILNQDVTGFVLMMLYPPQLRNGFTQRIYVSLPTVRTGLFFEMSFVQRRHLWTGGSPSGFDPNISRVWEIIELVPMIHLCGFKIPLWLGKSNSILV